MTHYDEQLKALQEKTARFRQLSAVLQELQRQRADLAAQVRQLEEIKLDEQADVDRLEGRSLKAFFYNVIGKMDEQLSKERQEAYAARVKYDAAARELEAVNDDIHRCKAEFRELHDCERQYKEVLGAKAAAIRAIKTLAQTAIATIGTTAVIEAVDWKVVVSASLLAALLSVLTSIAGLPEVED